MNDVLTSMPCINCLVFPRCRAHYLNNDDNTISRVMKIRFAISGCSLAIDYLYIKQEEYTMMDSQERPQSTILKRYDEQLAQHMVKYYDNPT